MAGTLLLAFLGGLILNLMPCVFPVLGIKVMGVVSHAGGDRRNVAMHGLMYTVGVLISFWALAGVLMLLRAGGHELAWGFQLQSAAFVFGLAVVMLIFALSLSGVFEFGTRIMGAGSQVMAGHGLGSSFFAGALATLVATPCSAPLLAPALGVALVVSAIASFFIFSAIALGLALPYLLLSLFPRAVALLPRPGRWMETFKQLMAFPLYATVGYFIWILAGQTSDNGLLMALLGLTLIAMAVWLHGRNSQRPSNVSRVPMSFVLSAVLFIAGLYMGWPVRTAESSEVTWEPWSAERVDELRTDGRPIYVDFTARWCATCQVNKKVVFTSAAVKEYLRMHRVATLKADWTNSDPKITAELEKWHRAAVPFDLIYLPGHQQPIVLPEVLTPGVVLDALHKGERS
jgi:thiol:disulfide interchange protein